MYMFIISLQDETGFKQCHPEDTYCGKMQCILTTKPKSGDIMKNMIKWKETGMTKDCISKHYPKHTHANEGELGLAKDGKSINKKAPSKGYFPPVVNRYVRFL